MPMVSKSLLALVFAGGALGTSIRYAIEILVGNLPQAQLTMTSIVNLLGATLLGFISNHRFFRSPTRESFWAVGFLGGFTTMSGLALITAGSEFGLSTIGLIYWFIVLAQLALGVACFRLGLVIASRSGGL